MLERKLHLRKVNLLPTRPSASIACLLLLVIHHFHGFGCVSFPVGVGLKGFRG